MKSVYEDAIEGLQKCNRCALYAKAEGYLERFLTKSRIYTIYHHLNRNNAGFAVFRLDGKCVFYGYIIDPTDWRAKHVLHLKQFDHKTFYTLSLPMNKIV
jgi:hypothetical protein